MPQRDYGISSYEKYDEINNYRIIAMTSLKFSVPYNNDPETLDDVLKLKDLNGNKIVEVYLSGPQNYSGSGRVMPEINMKALIETIKRVHKDGIKVNLLFNTTCEGANWYSSEVVNSKMEFLQLMHEEHGVEAVTIANPIYIKETRKRFPDITICSSVLAEINSVQKAVIHREAGADIITPDVNINRSLELLEQIKKATGATLKPMVNEGCMYKCPFRRFHFNYTSHQSQESVPEDNTYFNECQKIISEDLSQILKSCWIRPEDTIRYNGITDYFKIVGRGKARSRVTRMIKAYMEEDWQGDLLDILCASFNMFAVSNGAYLDNKRLDNYNFFERVTACDKNCQQCNYCSQLSQELIKLGIMTRHKLEDFGMKDVADRLERKFQDEPKERY